MAYLTSAADTLQAHHMAKCPVNARSTHPDQDQFNRAKYKEDVAQNRNSRIVSVNRIATKYDKDYFAFTTPKSFFVSFSMLYLAIKHKSKAKVAFRPLLWDAGTHKLEGESLQSLNDCMDQPVQECPRTLRLLVLRSAVVTVGAHANMLFVDRVRGTVERFEPHGNEVGLRLMTAYRYYLLDAHLASWAAGRGLCYMPPLSLNGLNGYVLNSRGSIQKGDWIGFCVGFSVWYADMRLTYPDMHPLQLYDALYMKLYRIRSAGGNKAKIAYMYAYVNQINALMVALLPKYEYLFRDKTLFPADDDETPRAMTTQERIDYEYVKKFAAKPPTHILRQVLADNVSLQAILETPAILNL